MNEGGVNKGIDDSKLIVQEANKRTPIEVLLTSWSPAGKYKSNGKPANDGTKATLAKDDSGNFVYNGFANWWFQSLLQYKSRGINPAYIGIQNEPNFNPGYEGCIFMPQEQLVLDEKLDSTYMVASYSKAFNMVYEVLDSHKTELVKMPKMIGPEVIGIENAWSGKPSDYTKYMDMSRCYAVAHHLYTGGNPNDADSYIYNLGKIAGQYPSIPKMQTEFNDGDWYSTALLVQNSLIYENVNSYLVWTLCWPNSDFLAIENPWTSGSWISPNGYTVGKEYYAFKQFTKFIKPGWRRTGTTNKSFQLRSSSFISPDGSELSIVVINTSTLDQSIFIDPLNFKITDGNIYRTSATENCILIGNYTSGNITLPPKSITTLSLKGYYTLDNLTVLLRFPVSGQYLIADDTTAAIRNNGGTLVNSMYQYFMVVNAGDSLVALLNKGYGKYVSVSSDTSLAAMANSDTLGDNQKFRIIYNNDGTLSFLSVSTGKYLHVEGSPLYTPPQPVTGSGTNITIAEKFSFRIMNPFIDITSPSQGSLNVDNDLIVNITVDARDPDGTVSKVEYFMGDIKIGQSTVSPFNFQWMADTAGVYTMTAKVTDNSNLSYTSAPVTFRVSATSSGEYKLINKLSVYPNPFTSESGLTISGSSQDAKYAITSLTGQVLEQGSLETSNSFINGNSLEPGIYLLTIIEGPERKIFRIIKQ